MRATQATKTKHRRRTPANVRIYRKDLNAALRLRKNFMHAQTYIGVSDPLPRRPQAGQPGLPARAGQGKHCQHANHRLQRKDADDGLSGPASPRTIRTEYSISSPIPISQT